MTARDTLALPSGGGAGVPDASGTSIVAVTRGGATLALRLAGALPEAHAYVPRRFAMSAIKLHPSVIAYDERAAPLVGRLFSENRALILLMATGAAVRLIAPHLRDKAQDPAVVVVDEAARFAIALVSGHLGGANALATQVAGVLGAQPVITTASEARGVPSADLIGRAFGWRIANPEHLTALAAALVNGDPVGLFQEAGERTWHDGPLPAHVTSYPDIDALCAAAPAAAIIISDRELPATIARPGWVVYRSPSLVLGIGCSRGATLEAISNLVDATLAAHGLASASVGTVASIDLKMNEPGLRGFITARGYAAQWFTAAELDGVPGQEHPSAVVRAAVGTRGVCEPAALRAAGATRLLVPKQKSNNVTVAVARRGGVRASAPVE